MVHVHECFYVENLNFEKKKQRCQYRTRDHQPTHQSQISVNFDCLAFNAFLFFVCLQSHTCQKHVGTSRET